jgi:hypothetical protein
VLQGAVFGFERRPEAIIPPLVSLTTICLVSAVVLRNRVGAPARN